MTDQATLEKALQANLALQRAIAKELENLSRKKAQNRRWASRCTQQLADGPGNNNNINNNTLERSDSSTKRHCRLPQVNPYRKWKRSFFVDQQGSEPEPNPDVQKRRALEDKTFFCHLQPPWTSKESTELQAVVLEIQKSETDEDGIDFEQVASLLNQRVKRSVESMALPRTAAECKLQYQHLTRAKQPLFSKDESRKISEMVHLQIGSPDWQEIANALPNHRTAWECFTAYQAKICPQPTEPWTVAEDKLLLSYVAAAGPQFIADSEALVSIASRLLPHRSKRQLLSRIHHSLLNPNLKRDAWSDDEERRLAILMKMYRDSSPSSLFCASTHLPHRATKSVADKWQRSLNPEYSASPFTKQEDELLLHIVRSTGNKSWTDISRRHFPNRHPQRLNSRWTELANDNDILARSGKELVTGRKRNSDIAQLDADDFVVQLGSKRR